MPPGSCRSGARCFLIDEADLPAIVVAAAARLLAAFDIRRETALTISATAWVLAFTSFALSFGPLLANSAGLIAPERTGCQRGLTSKLHVVVDVNGRPVRFGITTGE